MPRPPRIDFPDALYHVTSRGNGRRPIFWTDADRERFLCQLAEALRTYGVLLYAFVEMDNHILCGASHNTFIWSSDNSRDAPVEGD